MTVIATMQNGSQKVVQGVKSISEPVGSTLENHYELVLWPAHARRYPERLNGDTLEILDVLVMNVIS